MERRIPQHEKMNKLMIDPSNGDILIVIGVEDLSYGWNGGLIWQCVVHEYLGATKEYSAYYSIWNEEHFDDLIPLTSATMMLYGSPELQDTPLEELEAKLRSKAPNPI